MDELERGSPFQQRDEEPSPQSDAEKSVPNEEPSPGPDNDEVDAGSQVMGRLPRTRPQRRSGRRPANAAKESSSATPKRKPSTRSRPRTSAGARSSGSSAARARATGGQAARRRPTETATRAAARKRAPGIPQLAAGAAFGVAKLPLKVTASVARQATSLIGRGLRLR